MAIDETVLVIRPDGTASLIAWPSTDESRRAVIATQVGPDTIMRRCGKGILGFAVDDAATVQDARSGWNLLPENECAAAAFAEQSVELGVELRGSVLFARNPSKGSVVKPLTAAQIANLLVVTGARLD